MFPTTSKAIPFDCIWINLKEAYSGSLEKLHFFSDLTRYVVIAREMGVLVSKLSFNTYYLEMLMALETDKGYLIKTGYSKNSQIFCQ